MNYVSSTLPSGSEPIASAAPRTAHTMPCPGPAQIPVVPATVRANNHNDSDGGWMDVAYTRGTEVTMTNYFSTNMKLLEIGPDNNPATIEEFADKIIPILPGMAYKFRVAAVNSMGIGPWSEVQTFKTPGLPGAPKSVKVEKKEYGVILSWDAPLITSGHIIDYAVFLAIYQPCQNEPTAATVFVGPPGNSVPMTLVLQKMYSGPCNQCIIPSDLIAKAKIDSGSGKSSPIIFRISARNLNGYGPSSKVRWLQD